MARTSRSAGLRRVVRGELGTRGARSPCFAAASLTEAFTEIGTDFEAESGSTVTFNFGSSSTLATQITQGAPADVFAAASPATMKTVTDAGGATEPVNFVSNTLQIAVPTAIPARSPGWPTSPTSPSGSPSARRRCRAAPRRRRCSPPPSITPKPDTLEQDVKATLAKVAADEVDAALVYQTDVISEPSDVEGIDFPEAGQAVNQYPIATVTETQEPGRGPGVRGLRAVRRGPGGAGESGLCQAGA